ncbi:MAG: bifunctional 2-polyprenyl-6-hydroxyphenol methylase/3-demethylubiquinol 3-O-methyltransferase UbiG [Alphaproteobacteria bacterium]|nr:bifunctional 2-polyprenyl-6-hydroxyphenol methylase/3-demethylubiquinol 3-O-methyltransferase UbiG [Alphaproteobacteria bacterium]
MKNTDQRYYEPLEQMMAIRHSYMAKVIRNIFDTSIFDFFSKKEVLDLGCGTGKFLYNYFELGSKCTGVDNYNNFQFKNKRNFSLLNFDIINFLKKNKLKFDVIFIYEFLEHLSNDQREILFKHLSKILNSNGIIFISTLNKNPISKFLSINVAENILNLLPKNTHDPKLFITPAELEYLAKMNKLKLKNVQGITYNPIFKTFKLSQIDLVNYFVTLTN